MNELTIRGTQSFMGKEIPVVLGGFGQNKKCISDNTIAEIHGMTTFHIRELINRNISRFRDNVDYLDLKVIAPNDDNLLLSVGYSQMQISKAAHIYILSERGYAKLIKIMDTDLAWEIHDKLIDEYFELRDGGKQITCIEDVLIQSLQEMKDIKYRLDDTNKRIDDIREVVALNPNSWREDARRLIVQIAHQLGGNEYIKDVNAEIFNLVDIRAGVSLKTRLTNKRRRMADEGVCKSKRNNVNRVDVIADDKKLIEIYLAVVKEMAVKYGVAQRAG